MFSSLLKIDGDFKTVINFIDIIAVSTNIDIYRYRVSVKDKFSNLSPSKPSAGFHRATEEISLILKS